MTRLTLPVLLVVSATSALAGDLCDKVVPGYERADTMYVVCASLPVNNNEKASELIREVMAQYVGPPDEIIVYFVKSKASVGKLNPSPTELAGYYYSHSNELVVWHGAQGNKATYKIKWR